MFKLFRSKKKPEVNNNNKTTEMETWIVRWNRRYGDYSGDYKEVAQFFASEDDAKAFKDELKEAISLLGHTAGHLTKVTCKKVDKNKKL